MDPIQAILDKRIPIKLLQVSEGESVIFCKNFKSELFDSGFFSTKEKDFVHNYITENNQKYIVTDVTTPDEKIYKNVKFRVVVNEKGDVPYCTFNPKGTLIEKGEYKLPEKPKLITEQNIQKKETANKQTVVLRETPDYQKQEQEYFEKAKKLQERLIQEQYKLENERKELEKQKLVVENEKVISEKLNDYKQVILQEFFNVSEKQEKTIKEKLTDNYKLLEERIYEQNKIQNEQAKKTLDQLNEKGLEQLRRELDSKINDKQKEIERLVEDKAENSARLLVEKADDLRKLFEDKFVVDLEQHKNDIFEKFNKLSRQVIENFVDEKAESIVEELTKQLVEAKKEVEKQDKQEKQQEQAEEKSQLQTDVKNLVNKEIANYQKDLAEQLNDLRASIEQEIAVTAAGAGEGGGGNNSYDYYPNGGPMLGNLLFPVSGTGIVFANGQVLSSIPPEFDNQTLIFNNSNYDLSITGGNTVSLSALKDNLSEIISTSAYWNTAYTNLVYNSAAYLSGTAVELGQIPVLSANWNASYTNLIYNSAAYLSAYDMSLINSASANWNNTYTQYSQNSSSYATIGFVNGKFLPLSGGTITGNLTIQGSITALGTATFANTIFTTTSAVSVVNTGPGPALYVYQTNGPYDVASFYDGDGVEVLHVGNANPGGNGFVGINESFPAVELSVRGAVSASKTITALGGNSDQWNASYTNLIYNSASYLTGASLDYVNTTFVKISGDTMTGTLSVAPAAYVLSPSFATFVKNNNYPSLSATLRQNYDFYNSEATFAVPGGIIIKGQSPSYDTSIRNLPGLGVYGLRLENVNNMDPGTTFVSDGRAAVTHAMSFRAGIANFTAGSDHNHVLWQGAPSNPTQSWQVSNGGNNTNGPQGYLTNRFFLHTLPQYQISTAITTQNNGYVDTRNAFLLTGTDRLTGVEIGINLPPGTNNYHLVSPGVVVGLQINPGVAGLVAATYQSQCTSVSANAALSTFQFDVFLGNTSNWVPAQAALQTVNLSARSLGGNPGINLITSQIGVPATHYVGLTGNYLNLPKHCLARFTTNDVLTGLKTGSPLTIWIPQNMPSNAPGGTGFVTSETNTGPTGSFRYGYFDAFVRTVSGTDLEFVIGNIMDTYAFQNRTWSLTADGTAGWVIYGGSQDTVHRPTFGTTGFYFEREPYLFTSSDNFSFLSGGMVKNVVLGTSESYGLQSYGMGFRGVVMGNRSGVLAGEANVVYSDYSVALGGQGLISLSGSPYQAVIGKYNNPNNNALLVVGNGLSDTNRSNILEVSSSSVSVSGVFSVQPNATYPVTISRATNPFLVFNMGGGSTFSGFRFQINNIDRYTVALNSGGDQIYSRFTAGGVYAGDTLGLGSGGDVTMNTSQFKLINSTGNVGIGTNSPQAKLTVVGTLSTNNTITSLGGDSNQWNASYTNLIYNSTAYLSAYDMSLINSTSANWNSVYSTVNTNSANYILDGGNTKAANLLIGTNDNFDLGFETNAQRRLVLSNTGSLSGNNPFTSFNSGSASGQRSFAVNSGRATALFSFAEGENTVASGQASHAEGYQTIASGTFSHAEGLSNMASGQYSHAEGIANIASGTYSHAEGSNTRASKSGSHSEGIVTAATGNASHSEGLGTVASGEESHAEGYFSSTGDKVYYASYSDSTRKFTFNPTSLVNDKFAGFVSGETIVGYDNDVVGDIFFATVSAIDTVAGTITIETDVIGGTSNSGYLVNKSGTYAHAEGNNTIAAGTYAHSEGDLSRAMGDSSHAEGGATWALGNFSHSEGENTIAGGAHSHAAGSYAYAAHDRSWAWQGSTLSEYASTTRTDQFMVSAEGGVFIPGNLGIGTANNNNALTVKGTISGNNILTSFNQGSATGNISFAIGNGRAFGQRSFAQGNNTIAFGSNSYVEGSATRASGSSSHAEGTSTQATNTNSHAEGSGTLASGQQSHSEGTNTTSSGTASHAEGQSTQATGNRSHAEGTSTLAQGTNSHAEGDTTTASGNRSHTEGINTQATNDNSHAEGQNSQATGINSHAEGFFTVASGTQSHAEGVRSIASGGVSHALGRDTIASGSISHAQGNIAYATGDVSFAAGSSVVAAGSGSVAMGALSYARNDLDFIWVGDTTRTQYVSTTRSNQFMVSAAGGIYLAERVGINTDNIDNALTVNGTISTGKIESGAFIATPSSINNQTATDYVLSNNDNGRVITLSASSAITLAVPSGLPVGFNVMSIQIGTGQVTVSAGNGVTINSDGGKLKIASQHSAASLISYDTDIFNLAGNLTA